MKEINKNKKIAKAMTGIGDDLLKEANSYHVQAQAHVRHIPRRITLIAATLSILIVIGVSIGVILHMKNKSPVVVPEGIVFSGSAYSTDGIVDLPDSLKTVNITADGSPSHIIPVSCSLLVETSGECDNETLTQYLKVTPETPMSVTKLSSTQFKLTPASSGFVPGTVYRVTVGDPENPAVSYAFQTETELCIKSILPADLKTDVPVDTGIEITFSDSVGNVEFEDYITITPSVKGEFMLYPDGRTVGFIPSKNLKYNSIYEVNVKAGIVGVSGKTLAEGMSVRFRTAAKDSASGTDSDSYCWLNTELGTMTTVFSPTEEAYFNFTCRGSNIREYGDLKVSMYKYSSVTKAMSAIQEHESHLGDSAFVDCGYSTKGLEHINDYTASVNSNYKTGHVSLGAGLETGVYLLKMNIKVTDDNGKTLELEQYGFIQISNLRSYNLSSDGKTIVWVNKVGSGAVSDAEISGTRFTRVDNWNDTDASDFVSVSGETSADGTYVFENGGNTAAILGITSGSDSLICCMCTSVTDRADYYMKHLYTDREVYFSDDKVNFWGFIAPAYSDAEIPGELYLQTGNSCMRYKVSVGEDGSFSGSYLIESMRAEGIFLKLTDADGNVMLSKYIQVTEEKKPQIQASITFDKLFYRYGETVNVTLSASFFDGTPAPGFKFNYSSSPFCTSESSGTTDSKGQIKFSISTATTNAHSTDPIDIYVEAELSGMETQTLRVSNSVNYFHSDYVFAVEYGEKSRALTLNVRDTSKLLTDADLSYSVFPANTVGTNAQGSVSYSLIKYVITKTEKTNYDTYTKRKYTTYEYNTTKSIKKTGEYTFTDGRIELPMMEVEGFTGGYYYEITYNDGRQNFVYTVSATKSRYVWTGKDTSYEIKLDRDCYGIGDTVSAQYLLNGVAQQNVLFVMFGNGLHDYSVGSNYTAEFDATMLPAASLYGVFFDADAGTYIFRSAYVPFDYESKAKLDVELITDKNTYKPGENASLTVKVKGANGGVVLISVVDEACFALGEQKTDIASSFFKSVGKTTQNDFYSSYYYNRYNRGNDYNRSQGKSVTVNGTFNAAGYTTVTYGGGLKYNLTPDDPYYRFTDGDALEDENKATGEVPLGNGESTEYYIRQIFADNPEFQVVTLSQDGEGTLTFKVPDNITSWRITASAASGLGKAATDIKVGNAVSDIICTQPFFINPDTCSQYIVGDDITVSARSYGSAASGEITYTATLYNADGTALLTQTATADCIEHAWINFGKQEAGQYSVMISADCGEYKDAVKASFDIIESGIVMDVRKDVTVEELKGLKPLLYPVTLTFYDKSMSYGVYNNVVNRLRYGNDSDRADMLAAQYIALIASEKLYGTETTEDCAAIIDRLDQYGSDYVSMLQYSSEDPELTAQILVLAPELINSTRREKLVSLYNGIISSGLHTDESSLCSALMALTAMDEPILDRLYSVASVAKNYPTQAKLYLCAAFACIGDYSAANDIFAEIKAEYGVEDTEYGTLYLNGNTTDETIRMTSLALFSAARISKTDAEEIANYLVGNGTKDVSSELALAAYLKFFMPTGDNTGKELSYRFADGEIQKTTIRPGHVFSLRLTKSELENLKIVSVDKNIGIRAAYGGTAEEALGESERNDRVTISKKISSYGNGMYLVTLDITGKSTRICESFELTDCIPSGARFFAMYTKSNNYKETNNTRTYAYIRNTSGQKMSGYVSVYNSKYSSDNSWQITVPEYEFSISVSYVIRGAVDGEYIAESAIIRNRKTEIFSISERYLVTVCDGKDWTIKESK